MTPIEDVFSLPSDTLLDRGKVDKILALGHSRVPIHTVEKDEDFVGMLSELVFEAGARVFADRSTSSSC